MNNVILQRLKEVAEDSEPVSKVRLAAAILYKNKIVSIGRNQYKTHPIMLRFCKNPEAIYLHAEVDAINRAKKILTLTLWLSLVKAVKIVSITTTSKRCSTHNDY
jgi:tRNA(Arg) A34 adenosine deaminase TadA